MKSRQYPVRNLSQIAKLLNGKQQWIPLMVDRQQLLEQQSRYDMAFRDIKGQHQAKRALEVAVAGGHNIVIVCTVQTAQSHTVQNSTTTLKVQTSLPDRPRHVDYLL